MMATAFSIFSIIAGTVILIIDELSQDTLKTEIAHDISFWGWMVLGLLYRILDELTTEERTK